MIYGQNQISQGQTPGRAGSMMGFGPGYTSGGGMVGLPDLQAQQMQAQQMQAQQMQAAAMQQAQMQAMQQAQQQLAQAQMGAQQMAAQGQFMPAHIDALWAKMLDRLAISPVADDSQLFADVSAVVIQSFAPQGSAHAALKRWAEQYTGQQQQQQQQQQQIEMPMQIPQEQVAVQQQAAQQQTGGSPFVAGRIRNHF